MPRKKSEKLPFQSVLTWLPISRTIIIFCIHPFPRVGRPHTTGREEEEEDGFIEFNSFLRIDFLFCVCSMWNFEKKVPYAVSWIMVVASTGAPPSPSFRLIKTTYLVLHLPANSSRWIISWRLDEWKSSNFMNLASQFFFLFYLINCLNVLGYTFTVVFSTVFWGVDRGEKMDTTVPHRFEFIIMFFGTRLVLCILNSCRPPSLCRLLSVCFSFSLGWIGSVEAAAAHLFRRSSQAWSSWTEQENWNTYTRRRPKFQYSSND